MRLITGLFLGLAALAGCTDRSATATDPRVADPLRPLVFLTHPTQSPCSYLDAKGECAGTDVALAKKIAAKMNRKLVCEACAFESIIPRLKAGTADFAIATITITAARRRDVDFSRPYATAGNCFLYRADTRKPRMSHLTSHCVGVEAGTTGDLYLCQHGGDPTRYANVKEALAGLEKGDVDAVFFDASPLRAFAGKSNGRFIAMPLETCERYGVAVDKRRTDVLEAANAVIAAEGGAK